MRRYLLIALPFIVSLGLTTAAAQAVVVDMNAVGQGASSVPYDSSDQSGYFGVALVPGTRSGSSTTSGSLGWPGSRTSRAASVSTRD